MKKLFITFCAIIMMAFSCGEKTSLTPFSDNITRLKSGQSFGMCLGTCYNELIVENNTVILKQLRTKERGGEAETLEYPNNDSWNQIKAELTGFSQKKF